MLTESAVRESAVPVQLSNTLLSAAYCSSSGTVLSAAAAAAEIPVSSVKNVSPSAAVVSLTLTAV